MAYQITSGVVPKPQKVLLYGPEGIGKSSLAARFPSPLFIDTEGGSAHLDVRRLPSPSSWSMLLDEVAWVRDFPAECGGTLVVDTADWAESLCQEHVCARAGKSGIEDFSYGKGYVYVKEEFGKLLNLLSECCERGLNVCVTAHAQIVKFEQPDEMGAYDRWELKLARKHTAPMLKEWADAVLFLNYRSIVVRDENGKAKAQNGKDRVMYATHAATWDAKNRWGLPDELPLDWAHIAPHIPVLSFSAAASVTQAEIEAARDMPVPFDGADVAMEGGDNRGVGEPYAEETVPPRAPEHLRKLAGMLAEAGIGRQEFVVAVARRTGYVTEGTPFESIAPDLAAWAETVVPQIKQYIDAGMPAEGK